MAGKADYAENAVLNAFFRGVTFPVIATVYIGLWKTNPSGDPATDGVEQDYAGYARVPVTCNTTNWKDPSTATQGSINNLFKIVFPVANAAGSPAVGFFAADAVSGGNVLYWNSMTSTPIAQGDQPFFDVGALIFTED